MLKEVFLIEQGILQFHYSKDMTTDESDQALLSSGLLTAIRDFSQHARSDVLESFSTENEYFLFTACPDSQRILVGVFDRKAPTQVAREALQRIAKIIQDANIPEYTGEVLNIEKRLEIRERIDRIATQLFGRDMLAKYIEEMLSERTDIPLAFMVDAYDKTLLAHFARPRPLFKESQVQDFLLLHSTILSSIPKLGLDSEYQSFRVESADYVVAACRAGRLISIASGAMRTPAEAVESATYQMCYDLDASHVREEEGEKIGKTILKAALHEDGSERVLSGGALPTGARVFVSNLVKNIDSFFRGLTRRQFSLFKIRSGKDIIRELVITKDDGSKTITIEFLEF
ncbi:MAG: hypothetical protein ACFFEF_02535 [Candidatus Thorarchaeota archaeon]